MPLISGLGRQAGLRVPGQPRQHNDTLSQIKEHPKQNKILLIIKDRNQNYSYIRIVKKLAVLGFLARARNNTLPTSALEDSRATM